MMGAGWGSEPPTAQQVLDELDALATVEHSLVIEFLLLHSVLGHDIPPSAGPSDRGPGKAAQVAFRMATREMRHLHQLNQVLTSAGRAAQVGRSSTIDGGLLPLVTPDATPSTIDRIVERERGIAAAVDARYARLRAAVTSTAPPISGAVLDKLSFILDVGPDHAGALGDLEAALQALAPGGVARGTHDGAADRRHGSLLDLSDQWYGLVLAIVDAWFSHEAELGGDLFGRAISAMDDLNAVNRSIVERGLLPRFTPPER